MVVSRSWRRGNTYRIPAIFAARGRGELVLQGTDDGRARINVRLIQDSVWLTLNQIADLFQRDKSVISGELDPAPAFAGFVTVQTEGGSIQLAQTSQVLSLSEPLGPVEILLQLLNAVVKRNPPVRKKALKVELWEPCEMRRLTQSQPLPLKQRQRQFSLQLGLGHFGYLKKFIRQRKGPWPDLILFPSASGANPVVPEQASRCLRRLRHTVGWSPRRVIRFAQETPSGTDKT